MDIQLQVKQKQELQLTPELLQSIRILQMNRMELSEYVAQEILENPVLEEVSSEDSMSAQDLSDRIEQEYEDRYDRYDRYDESGSSHTSEFEAFVREEMTLKEHLLDQMRMIPMTKSVRHACKYLIGNLDGDGYLFYEEEGLREDYGDDAVEAMPEALEILQSMDPAGVGAKDLCECLKLQLARTEELTESMGRLIDEYLGDIAENRIAVIAKALGINKKMAQEMVDRIRRLEPKPGRRFSDGRAVSYVIPDVIVTENDERMDIYLNREGMPSLQVGSYYREVLRDNKENEEVSGFLSDRFQAAESLIRNIRQRDDTILRVTEEIIRQQRQFFRPGNRLLRPMTMQEVADALEIHVATVSRAVDGKYIQVNGNTYSLRHFFGSGVPAEGGDGSGDDVVSASTVKKAIREMIDDEDPAHPISDQKIADTLAARGIAISRRTVAKYREAEGIASTSKRRRY